MRVKLRVPATVANVGPGFDTAGVALQLWSYCEIQPSGSDLQLAFEGEGQERFAGVARQMIERALEKCGMAGQGLRLRFVNRIPAAKGLGASAALRLAVLYGLRKLSGPVDIADVVSRVTELEGHSDNAAAAAAGGFVVSARTAQGVVWHRTEVPEELKFVVCLPDRETLTDDARKMLPDHVPLGDAVFNIQRASLLVAAFFSRDFELLREALQDRIHQRYRAPMVGPFDEVARAARDAGALGVFIGGSGPALVAVVATGNTDGIARAMEATFQSAGIGARTMILPPSNSGLEEIE